MDLPNVLMTLSRDPTLVAWRSTGTVIRVTPSLKVERVFIERPYRYWPGYHDLVASDWQFGTAEGLQRQLMAQMQTEQGG